MNISLPGSLRDFVEAQVSERGYTSASEFLRELIREARDRKTRDAELRDLVQHGLKQLRDGEYVELDEKGLPKFFEAVRTRARKRLKAEKRWPRGRNGPG